MLLTKDGAKAVVFDGKRDPFIMQQAVSVVSDIARFAKRAEETGSTTLKKLSNLFLGMLLFSVSSLLTARCSSL